MHLQELSLTRLGLIYTIEEIEKAKRSPSFEREYNLRYLGRIGNTFRSTDIQKAISIQYDSDYVNPMSTHAPTMISYNIESTLARTN
jgi:hypothetical protein